jgi:hypothetical protein
MFVSRYGQGLSGALLAIALVVASFTGSADAQQQQQLAQAAKRGKQPVAAQQVSPEQKRKDAINSWTVGLAAGRTEGAPLQFASELARVVDDGDNMRVLPIVTRGPFDNVFDLLYLRGVDAAIVYGDVLEHFKNNPEIAGIGRRINFLMNLFPSELHIFVRPEINSLKDLEGKAVNFNTVGTAAAYSGPIIFKQLGINVDAQFIPHNVAMESMRKGEKFASRAISRRASSSCPSSTPTSSSTTCPPISNPRTTRRSFRKASVSRRSPFRRCSPSTTGRVIRIATSASHALSITSTTASRDFRASPAITRSGRT